MQLHYYTIYQPLIVPRAAFFSAIIYFTTGQTHTLNRAMATKAPLSTLQRLRLVYKTSRFPWKKHVMVGWDLDGNEYWEMPNPNNPGNDNGGATMTFLRSNSITEQP